MHYIEVDRGCKMVMKAANTHMQVCTTTEYTENAK